MYVILGAAGKLGRQTVRGLRSRNLPVRAVVREATRAAPLRDLGCETGVADLRDGASLDRVLDGAQAVQVICPVMPREADALAAMKRVTEVVAGALERARPQVVLAISDYGAEVPAGTGVTMAFHHLEERLAQLPAAVIFVRSAEHMENWTRFVKVAAETGELPSMHQPLTKQFPTVSAGDVGIIAAELLAGPPPAGRRIVAVEGPRRVDARDVAAAFAVALGREVVSREVGRQERIPALLRGGLSESYAALVAELYEAHNAGKIDVEPGAGEVRRGSTDIATVVSGTATTANFVRGRLPFHEARAALYTRPARPRVTSLVFFIFALSIPTL